jgi:hypothetical protein
MKTLLGLLFYALGACCAHAQNPQYNFNLVSTEILGDYSFVHEGQPPHGFQGTVIFTLQAIGGDAWMWRRGSESFNNITSGATWKVVDVGNGETVRGDNSASIFRLVSGGHQDANIISILEGETATMRIEAYYTPTAPFEGFLKFDPELLWIAPTRTALLNDQEASYVFPADFQTDAVYVKNVPEPSALALLLAGGIGAGLVRRRK